jgi:hypothetical protein
LLLLEETLGRLTTVEMIDNGVQKKSGWDISESIGLTAKKPFNSTVSKDRMSLAFPPVVVEDPRFCARRREISSDEMVAPRTEIDINCFLHEINLA